MTESAAAVFTFDSFRVEPLNFKVWRGEEEIVLEPKTLRVLVYLLDNRDRLIEKEDLLNAIWQDTFVTENAMAREIAKLRKALGDDPKEAKYIQTVHTKGYRFIGEVTETLPFSKTKRIDSTDARPPVFRRYKLVLGALGLAIAVLLGGFLGYRYVVTASADQIDSIAVLPFENTTGDPNSDYLADGLTESLINSMTDLRRVKVIARTTAFRYKGKQIDPFIVGRDLQVKAVLTGSIRQIGDRMNVQVDLVDTTTGAQLWGDGFDQSASDTLTVKQSIARQITDKLRLRLSGEEQKLLTRPDTTNPQAYDMLLRAVFYRNKGTPDSMRTARDYYQKAIDIDPRYALAYVGLADCLLLLGSYDYIPRVESRSLARTAVENALAIDSSLGEAHVALGYAYDHEWEWSKSWAEIDRAIELSPNYARAHSLRSNILLYQMRYDEALAEAKIAQRLDPLSSSSSYAVAYAYLMKNELGPARSELEKWHEIAPDNPIRLILSGWYSLKTGDTDGAIIEFERAVEVSQRTPSTLRHLGHCYGVAGRRDDARKILSELKQKHERGESVAQHIAGVYAGLGETDEAFAWLETAFVQHDSGLPNITYLNPFENLRSDPRYKDLLRRMNLPQ
jgi:TolB-like protein/DNA-binding winged helix-turn-helix (wHTH) protein/Flp pilus assembly protein TadD